MALQGVRQENCTGCFIAAIATLLGKTYSDVFSIFYPGRASWDVYDHGFQEISMELAAFKALSRVGIQAHRTHFKRFRTYAKRDQHALLIIRWASTPDLCHTIVFDGDAHKFIDPSFGKALLSRSSLKELEEQLEFGILIDRLPTKEENES